MKRIGYLAGALLCVSAVQVQAQELEEILEAHHEVIGLDQFKQHDSFVMRGTAMQMGMEFPVTIYQKRTESGTKMRMELEFQGQTMVPQAFNGEEGWKLMPGMSGGMEIQDATAEELAELKDMKLEGPFYGAEKAGHTLTLLGEDEFEGSPVYMIELKTESGFSATFYMDKETYIVLGQTTQSNMNGQEMSITQVMSNYQEVEGMVFPTSTETRAMGQTVLTMTISDVSVDEDIDDAIFERPEK